MSVISQTFHKALNTFLDTTPREWFAWLRDIFSFDFHFKNVLMVALSLSVVLHMLPVLWVWKESLKETRSGEAVMTLRDLLKKEDPVKGSVVEEIPKELTGVFYVDGRKKKVPVSMTSKLSGLLRQLQTTGTAWASTPSTHAKKVAFVATPQFHAQDWKELAKDNPKDDVPTGKMEDFLSKEIAKYDSQFQSCYEGALLKDSSMNGKIEFMILMGAAQRVDSAQVRFDGVGMPDSKQQLEGCLRGVAGKIHFQTQEPLEGKKLKFFVVLKSR